MNTYWTHGLQVFENCYKSSVNSSHFQGQHASNHLFCCLSNQTCEQRQVTHFQYLNWPDYGVPTSAVTLIDFLGAVKRQQKRAVKALGPQWRSHPLGPPLVVHCSAGIGRTGEASVVCEAKSKE